MKTPEGIVTTGRRLNSGDGWLSQLLVDDGDKLVLLFEAPGRAEYAAKAIRRAMVAYAEEYAREYHLERLRDAMRAGAPVSEERIEEIRSDILRVGPNGYNEWAGFFPSSPVGLAFRDLLADRDHYRALSAALANDKPDSMDAYRAGVEAGRKAERFDFRKLAAEERAWHLARHPEALTRPEWVHNRLVTLDVIVNTLESCDGGRDEGIDCESAG